MFIRVLLSVEFCFTPKTYLKGAPFYNALASRRSPSSPPSPFVDRITFVPAGDLRSAPSHS